MGSTISGTADPRGGGSLLESFADYTEPLKTFSAMVRCWQPDRPVFLVAHSMGGLIGATYLLTNQEELAGAILSGPAVKAPGHIPAATIFIGRVLSFLFPSAGSSRGGRRRISAAIRRSWRPISPIRWCTRGR